MKGLGEALLENFTQNCLRQLNVVKKLHGRSEDKPFHEFQAKAPDTSVGAPARFGPHIQASRKTYKQEDLGS